ncbi:YjgF-like protein [Aureobasidium pullulans]|uniref:YjgF-like protein n=1 Tax=Aureobasidium pullulans TaxID=5580 RepID=A0A4S9WUE0_AURPU|nr:YjgF-like protein [Aureobasidium pullulans]
MSEMKKIFTSNSMAPVGPYSQAIQVSQHIFVSGQIPADKNGNLVEGSIADKTKASCEGMKAILEEAGSSISKVIKTTVFLTDMKDFAEMNGMYEQYFSHKPARSCVAVKELPKGVPVEIEAIALS